jgi:hypothetical protein
MPSSRRWQAGLHGAAARLAYNLFPNLAALALRVQAAGLRFASIPDLFSRDLRQISPSSNDELLDLYGRSEQVLANRFAFFNLTEEFGSEIDWEHHPSPGWRAELHAFDYALDLAMTYRISREERYARHLRYLVAEWIAANPPAQGSGWKPRPLSRRIRNWILAADLARDDWERDPTFLSLVTESLALQTTYLSKQIHPENPPADKLDCARALNLVGKLFAGAEAAELGATAFTLLRNARERQLRDTPLPSARLHLAETFVELLLFAPPNDEPPLGGLKSTLFESLKALEAILWSDGTLPLFGPAAAPAPERITNLFAIAAVLYEEPRWKRLAGDFGVFPYLLLGEEGRTCFEGLPNHAWSPGSLPLAQGGLYGLTGTSQSELLVNALPTGAHEDFLSYEL